MDHHASKADQEEARRQFRIEVMREKLEEKPGGYDFLFSCNENGQERYKQVNVMWGDVNHGTICLVRADVTDMLAADVYKRQVQNVTQVAQSTVGITVFFADDLPEDRILSIGDEIRSWGEVRTMEYVSAEQAWESFKSEYFKDMEDLAEGFADDNPLAGSASFTIFLNDIGDQDQVCLLYTSRCV